MAIKKSEAILLKAFNWSESSRTVVFFARNFGKIALVDKGGRSFKSRRGRLLPFARMELTFYHSERQTRGYVREIELVQEYDLGGEGTIGRLAYGSAGCELLYLLLGEEEPHEDLYVYFSTFLAYVANADRRSLPPLFLTFFLRLLSHLGYHPSLTSCAICGRDFTVDRNVGEEVYFYPERGGVVDRTCQKPVDYYIPVSRSAFRKLIALQHSSLGEAAGIGLGFTEAMKLLELLVRFLSYQADIKSELKSLQFLEKLKSSDLR